MAFLEHNAGVDGIPFVAARILVPLAHPPILVVDDRMDALVMVVANESAVVPLIELDVAADLEPVAAAPAEAPHYIDVVEGEEADDKMDEELDAADRAGPRRMALVANDHAI